MPDDIERLLADALARQAQALYGDDGLVPAMSAGTPGRARMVWAALLGVAVLAAAVVATVVAVSAGSDKPSAHRSVAGRPSTSTPRPTTLPSSSTPVPAESSAPAARTVRVTADLDDGARVGIGEPIVLNFDPAPTSSSAFTKAARVTVDGRPADGAWFWEKPYADQPLQAHYRAPGYWPGHATIKVALPLGGLSAGPGLAYSGRLSSLTFTTGAAHVSVVNAATLSMTVTADGQLVRKIPVSLGAASTPTYNGTKIVMQKGEDVPGTNRLRQDGTVMMSGPGYTDDPVPWSVRVTASGEYVHAAGWNTHIGVRSTSNGCTNLKPGDGHWFYQFSQPGDVVKYYNTDGRAMNPLDGLGDWNIAWTQWAQGGLLRTH